jgi:hypothetical protein
MMTEEEWEELEDLVGKINSGKYKCGMAAQSCLLAAYKELKERREDEEWLMKRELTTYTGPRYVTLINEDRSMHGGPTIHAAILAARGGG